MDDQSKQSDRPRRSSSEAGISGDKGDKTAPLPSAPAKSLALSATTEKHRAGHPLLADSSGPPPTANGIPAASQVPTVEPPDPAGVRQSAAGAKDGAKRPVDTGTPVSATTAQSQTGRRRRKKHSSRKSRKVTEAEPDSTSRREKKRRSEERKSKAAAAEASAVAANEKRQPGAVATLTAADAQGNTGEQPAAAQTAQDSQTADVGGDNEDQQKEGSESSDTRLNDRARESASHAGSPCDAAKPGTVGAEQTTVEASEGRRESVACARTESNKTGKSRGAVTMCSPTLTAQPPYAKWRRGSGAAKASDANEGTAFERHGKRKLSTHSYTSLQELATSLKTYTTPARLVTFGQRSNPESQNFDNETKYLPFLLLFAVVFVSIVALLLWFMGGTFQHAAQGVCASPACAELAAAFDGVLNYSVDPCDDLDAFVCSKGLRRGHGARGGGRGAQSVVEQVIQDYELQMVKLFVDGDTAFAASRMVAEFLQECSNGLYETPPSIESFREFFWYVSVPWPFDTPGGGGNSNGGSAEEVHPLEAVLELTLKWGVDTWFRAYVHVVGRARLSSNFSHLPALFIETGAQASSWLNFVRTLDSSESRERYYRLFYSHYNATTPEPESIARELAVEKDVLVALDAARSPGTAPRAVVASIATIADAVANTTLDNWLDPVVDAPGGRSANSSTMAAVQDVRVLRAIQHLTSTYTAAVLMKHLSWWLVQILTVIGWPQGYVAIAGSQEAARSEVKLECYRIMADRFGLLMAAESAVKLFNRNSRQEVTHFFTGIISLLASAAAKAPWMSAEAKYEASRLLQDLEVITWPPEVYESNATLSALYAGFCSMCSENASTAAEAPPTNSTVRPLLMDYWWQVSTKFWDLSPEQRERMQWMWQEHQFEVLRYEPWNNRMRVSHAALSSLLYHPESTARRPANYGGLGAAFVLNALQMFQLPAADFNTDAVAQHFTDISGIHQRAVYLNCSHEFLANARDVFAMGLAWQALKAEEQADRERRGRRARRRSMIAIKDENRVEHLYGEDQLFFLTYCRSRCVAHRHMERGPDCNAAVRGTPDFGRVFKCDVGTPMVPRNACRVSDFF
ncbi:neprilysin-2-like isoform X2 [Dermacentor albipictus]|uniref:neprilysin-2-like isoform X2 n=1 Tax=Dermacentor albipictus TaxID=60249 RepID=UPI0031FDCA25